VNREYEIITGCENLHSVNDEPIAYRYNRMFEWFKHGRRHRAYGPAIIIENGDKFWYKEGKVHRLDGPVLECSNGNKEWYYEGKEIECNSIEEFLKIIKLKVFW